MIKSILSKFKKKASLKRFFSRPSLDKWVLLLVSIGSFLPWVKFPLSGGISSFNLYSPILLSWGLLFLPTAILTMIGIKGSRWFLFLLLMIVLSFPLQIYWDYAFLQDIISEITQKENIKQFAANNIYAPNIMYSPEDISLSDITNLWDDPWLRVFITVESLGAGFWIAFIGTIIISRKLGKRKFIIALFLSLILSLPGILTASFLTQGRDAFLTGNYLKSVDMYRLAMKINQSFGNKTLKELESYYMWLGESLFHAGVNDAPEVCFFLGGNLDGVNSFIKSKEMYKKSMSLSPAKKALARTMVKESVDDFNEKGFGSAMERLEEAFRLDKNQFEALFYMSYISLVLKDGELISYYSSLLFDRCKEKILLSDSYNVLGDMYHQAEKFTDSRAMYRESIKNFDNPLLWNYHAWKGIAGW